MSNQIVWMYYSKSNQGFFSHIGSGAQRLPNGNTLICAMTEGHFFEVTPDGDLVWEYISPVTKEGIFEVLPDDYPMANAVFRAYRYTTDHPALAERDLTPGATLTGNDPDYLTPDRLNLVFNDGNETVRFSLLQNHPNPFNPTTAISYQLTVPGVVQLRVFNLAGQVVKTLVDASQSAGDYQVQWDGTDHFGKNVSSGLYFYRLEIGNTVQTRKMTLMR